MDRIRITRLLISILGLLLGTWLVIGGMELRLFASYSNWHQQFHAISYPQQLFRITSLDLGSVTNLAWPMVVFGTSWGGALIGFWIGERWSVPAMILLAALAIPFPYPGAVIGVILLLLILSTPELRKTGTDRGYET
jgi:hypothetical protein